MSYTEAQRRVLERHFSVVDGPDHADIYVVKNLPPEIAATLNGVYSRSSKSMRDQFLDRLEQGLQQQGRTLDSIADSVAQRDYLSEIMADRSGRFLKTYAIDHGHNSLREGSVVHLAVEKVSQLVTRFIQRERRCSFEESSTRYISFGAETHWIDPDVAAAGGTAERAYREVLRETFALYSEFTERLLDHLKRRRPLAPGEQQGPWLRALRAEAFDSARYLLTPAILTKWGIVANARTISEIVSELTSHPLAEFRLVGDRMRTQAETVLPTLLAHAKPNAMLRDLHLCLPDIAKSLDCGGGGKAGGPAESRVELISFDEDLDCRLLASLLYEDSSRPFSEIVAAIRGTSPDRRHEILARCLERRGPRDPLPIGLEGASPFEFEILIDFGAFRDIGRHRKGFLQQQRLTVEHGFAVPPLIDEAGLGGRYRETLVRAAENQLAVARLFPHAASYVTPFAFLQRARIVFDPRQVAYFVELRSRPEGHFSYRKVAIEMLDRVRRVSPLFAACIRATEGEARFGRMLSEQSAEARRRKRMEAAGDA
ncbi:MAG: FAD-dependent thymidylate synthase [Planctomycetota bacterium]